MAKYDVARHYRMLNLTLMKNIVQTLDISERLKEEIKR
jgi:hypothetical protein